jgi:hypothetical protein
VGSFGGLDASIAKGPGFFILFYSIYYILLFYIGFYWILLNTYEAAPLQGKKGDRPLSVLSETGD